MADTQLDLDLSRYKLGWSDVEDYVFNRAGASTSPSCGTCPA